MSVAPPLDLEESPMARQFRLDAELMDQCIKAVRNKCSSEPGPWETRPLLASISANTGLAIADLRAGLWRLASDEVLMFVDDLFHVAKCTLP
jgi:hypothetical protein